jgi:hypothetical protein
MAIKEELDNLLAKLKTERDEINLNLHLASMEVKQEFDEAEQKWNQFKTELVDESAEVSEDLLAKAKVVGEELKDTYQRIANRLAK